MLALLQGGLQERDAFLLGFSFLGVCSGVVKIYERTGSLNLLLVRHVGNIRSLLPDFCQRHHE